MTGTAPGGEGGVRVGDVWADNDKRWKEPRYLQVTAVRKIGHHYVWARPVALALGDNGMTWTPDGIHRDTVIRQDRFRPVSNGFRLVERDGKAVQG